MALDVAYLALQQTADGQELGLDFESDAEIRLVLQGLVYDFEGVLVLVKKPGDLPADNNEGVDEGVLGLVEGLPELFRVLVRAGVVEPIFDFL